MAVKIFWAFTHFCSVEYPEVTNSDIITGGDSGIGRAIGHHLYQLESQIYMHL